MKKLVMLTLLVLSALLIACAKEDLPPEPPKPGATGGGAFAGRAVYVGEGQYAEDTADFFSISSDTPAFGETLTATCENDDFVYATGYDTDADGEWRELEYECEQKVGNWCRNSATADREVIEDNYAAGDNYILCYGCSKEEGVWNCHGNKWMAHQFEVVEETSEEETEGETVGCTSDEECAEGESCNVEAYQCVEVAGGCSTDADCEENFFCNDDGQCEELPTAPEGPEGETELAAEDCFDDLDNNGNGPINEGCAPYSCVEHTGAVGNPEVVNVTVSSATGQTQDWSDGCADTSNMYTQKCRNMLALGSPAYALNLTINSECDVSQSEYYDCFDSDGPDGTAPAECRFTQ